MNKDVLSLDKQEKSKMIITLSGTYTNDGQDNNLCMVNGSFLL
jgi:hypothetical protein